MMGTTCWHSSCGAHLATMIRSCAPNAQNGAVTVRVVENPPKGADSAACVYCDAPDEFQVSYYAEEIIFLGTEG